jgi:hypothetical protein
LIDRPWTDPSVARLRADLFEHDDVDVSELQTRSDRLKHVENTLYQRILEPSNGKVTPKDLKEVHDLRREAEREDRNEWRHRFVTAMYNVLIDTLQPSTYEDVAEALRDRLEDEMEKQNQP